jgi:hypothetical protein
MRYLDSFLERTALLSVDYIRFQIEMLAAVAFLVTGKWIARMAVLVNAEPRHPPLILAQRHDVKAAEPPTYGFTKTMS